MSRPSRAWLPQLALALLFVATTLWLWHWAKLNHNWTNDEELYRHFARGVARDFGSIFQLDPTYGRGIQRLHLMLFALPMAMFKNPAAFELGHLLFVAAYASAAIPAWLIARGCGVGPWAALIPAALVVLTPWAVVTTSFLAEPVGYGAFSWALWGIWRAATRPSVGGDVLAVALLGIAVVSRTAFILLLPVLPIVATAQAWQEATGDGRARERLRRLPAAALRRQPVAIGLALAAIAIVLAARLGILPGGISRFTGSYATGLPPADEIVLKWRTFLSRIDAGTGFLMFAAALPWLIAQIVRPRAPALHALAWSALLALLSVLVSIVWSAGDERYVMFIAVPVILAGSIALLARQIGPWMLAAGAAAAFALFFTPGWELVDGSDFGYFGYPAGTFMGRAVLVKLDHGLDGRTVAALLLAAGLLAAIAIAARPRLRRFLPWLVAPAAIFQLVGCAYVVRSHVNSVGSASGPSIAARALADQHVPRGEEVGIYAVSFGISGSFAYAWRELQYWNTTIRSVVRELHPLTPGYQPQIPYPFSTFDRPFDLDQRTGNVTIWMAEDPLDYLVVPQPPLAVTLDWKLVARSSYLPAALVKVHNPLRARSTIAGLTPEGYTTPGAPVTLTVYRAGSHDARCAAVDLVGPPGTAERPLGYRIEGNRGRLAAGERRRVFLPVRYRGAAARFQLDTTGKVDVGNGTLLGLQVGNFETLPDDCPSS